MDSYDRRKQKMDSLAKLNNIVRTGSSEKVEELVDHELKDQDILNEATEDGHGLSPLMVACQLQDQNKLQSMIELLVRKGANVDWQNKNGWTALMKAVKEKRIEAVRCLLSRNVNLELQNHEPASALMIACKQGDVNMVKLLLENNAQFDMIGQYKDYTGYNQSYDQSYYWKSPLVIAIENDHKNLAKLLLDKGASVVVGECDALTVAYKKGDTELVKILLDNKTVDVNFNNGEPMVQACWSENSEIVGLLLKKGAKVGLLRNRESPLMIAAQQNKMEIFQQVLAYSTPDVVNLTDSWKGYSALMMAIERGINVHTVTKMKMLLEKGADVNLKNKDGDNVLMITLSLIQNRRDDSSEIYDIVKLLLDAGAIIHKKELLSYNYPTYPYSVRLSKLLLERGIDFISLLSGKNETPLLIFTNSRQTELVKLCLDRGDDVNECDDSGVYPLWRAVERKQFEIFELLFERNADASICPNDRMSALDMLKENNVLLADFLQRAAENKNYKLVEFLLICGADAMIIDVNTGKSAFEILKANITSIMEMIDSGSETEYANLKLLMSHPEKMETEVEKLSHDIAVALSDTEQMDTSELEDIIELHTVSDDGTLKSDQSTVSDDGTLESDQSSARKRDRGGSASDVDVPAKKSCENLNEENFKARITKALHSNEKINRKHAHSVFLGPTGSGKTSLMDRLVDGKLKPILIYSSTDIAEEVAIIELNVDFTFCAVDVVSADAWQRCDLKKSLIRQVNEGVHAVQEVNEQSASKANLPAESGTTLSTAPFTPPSSESVSLVNVSGSEEMMAVAAPSPTSVPNNDDDIQIVAKPAAPFPASVPIDDDIQKVIDTVLNQSGIVEFEDLERKFSLYMRDAGGQVEFQESVSLLVFGPSIFFFVFRADLEFKKRFPVKYRKSASETLNCYKSSITLEESLLQSLASVYAMDTAKAGVKRHQPYVFIVATHKDKLGPSAEEKIAELDEHLSSLLENSNFRQLVQYADGSKGQVMFAVDNTSASDNDFKVIRLRIHSLICNKNEFNIEYPVSYLLFCLELQYDERSVLTLEECREMARKYGIVDDQVLDLLHFLHLNIGVIYFIEVEGVQPIILKQPQILFKAVTDVIVNSFSSQSLNYQQAFDVTKKGILTASAFKSIVPSVDKISPDDFLKILVHFHIITPFPTSADEQGERYFIPCVLNHVPKSPEEDLETDILPLAVKFKCNHFPRGLFGVLITHLMNPEDGEVGNVSLALIQEKLFKDQVSFEVKSPGTVDQILLKVESSYLSINFCPDHSEERDTSIPTACCEVRQRVENAIQSSLINLHYNNDRVGPMVCFECAECSLLHEVNEHNQRYTYYCQKSRRTIRIPTEGRCWFEQVSSHLRGVEVLQEKTLQVTSLPDSFQWEECGMKLNIPEKALHAHVKSCTLTIKASLSGHYKFPDDSELVSPVFWVSCEPHCSFAHPLSLEIEHWAPTENSDNFFMARAVCSQKDLPYTFETLQGVFNKHSTYGVVELRKFSGIGVFQKGSNQYRCWSDIFYAGSLTAKDIHFVVTRDHKTHIKKVKEHYCSLKAIAGNLDNILTFKEDKITLDLNEATGGRIIDGWQVIPAKLPIILKEDVIRYRPSSLTVPSCVLNAIWKGDNDQQMKPLVHTVNILGTTQQDFFVIKIDHQQHGIQEKLLAPSSSQSSPNPLAHKWVKRYMMKLTKDDVISVGVELGLSYTRLKNGSVDDMVNAWLQKADDVKEDPSWETLYKALRQCDWSGIASDIMKKEMGIIVK